MPIARDQLTLALMHLGGLAEGSLHVVDAAALAAQRYPHFDPAGPALVLGFLVALTGLSRFLLATAIVWIVGGLGTWLIGNLGSSCGPTDHIGASGLIFGWLSFLLVFGFFVRSAWQILTGIVVLFLYGGILWGAMPVFNVCGGVSWQGHLCGMSAGVLAAYLGRLGDERALPLLLERAREEGLRYLDYIELRSAIEALGGDAPERDFGEDPEYEALRGLTEP